MPEQTLLQLLYKTSIKQTPAYKTIKTKNSTPVCHEYIKTHLLDNSFGCIVLDCFNKFQTNLASALLHDGIDKVVLYSPNSYLEYVELVEDLENDLKTLPFICSDIIIMDNTVYDWERRGKFKEQKIEEKAFKKLIGCYGMNVVSIEWDLENP